MNNVKNEEKKCYQCDVAVIGSGSGGIASAVAAARNGAKVLLVEKKGYIGGMAAIIPLLGFLDSEQRLVVGGIATEFVEKLKADGVAHGIRYCPHHLSVVCTKADEVKITAAKFLEENGVDFLLHTAMVSAEVTTGKIISVTCQCAGTEIEIKAKVFIDATGDGVLSYLAGADYEKGIAGVDLQPPSIQLIIGGIDKEGFYRWVEEEHPEEWSKWSLSYLKEREDFVFVTLNHLWAKLNPLGKWPMEIWAMIYINRFNNSEALVNGPRMANTDATDPISITRAEVEGQRQALAFVEMLRKHVGGFENAFLSHMHDTIGVRETRRIVGWDTLTIEDVTAGKIDENTIALGSYPIDIHGSGDYSSEFIHFDKPYGIPYLATVAKSVKGLMMAGRCISTDSKAFGSSRVMGTCFAVSEAVGVGAALAAKQGCEPYEVDIKEIRRRLLNNGCVLSLDDNLIVWPKSTKQ